MRRTFSGRLFILILAGGCFCLGCSREDSARANINSGDVKERIFGIKAAAEAKDTSAIPLLVDRLEDEDDAVRFYAILALERITGERFGYHYSQPIDERARAVARWRAYVKNGSYLKDEATAADTRDRTTASGL